jgi:sirohydrochlorin ferrochelatase
MTVTLVRDDGARATASGTGARDRIVLIAHGSPDRRHRVGVSAVAARLQRITTIPASVAFLEHDEPLASDVLLPGLSSSGEDPSRTFVLPMLLSAGVHWQRDLPVLLSHHGEECRLITPPDLTSFAPAVRALVADHAPAPRHVILAAAGSRRPALMQRLSALGDVLRGGFPSISVAASPDALDGLGTPESVVVPVLVAEGILADRIAAAAAAAGAACTPVLGGHGLFAAALAAAL